MIEANHQKIGELYNWDNIIEQYADHLRDIYAKKVGRPVVPGNSKTA
jgi:hypothetical protein